MNKILVEVSVGELLDKISILEIKKEKIKDTDNLIFINDEYLVLTKQLDKNILSFFRTKFLLLFLLKLLISIVLKTIILKRTLIYEFIKG